ncbi:MAG: DUF1178 family protein [Paracoccaceae bacterium]|nr:DUF1178 family protein [Paracoccaceae bacterium]
MIQFSLKCSNDHRFDSWFQSSEAYDKLARAGMISCTICGATSVDKAVMAPRVRPARDAAPAAQPDQPRPTPLAAQPTPAEQALAALRQHIETHSDYVGRDFAREARAIHDGKAPDRAIFGEARPEEARRLLEDGVPIAPLPFMPRRKTN